MHFFAVVVVVAAVGDAAFVRCSFFFSLIVRMSVSRRLTLLRIHSIVNSQLEWTTAFGWTPPSLVFMYSELVGTSLKNGIAQRYHSHVFRFILFVLALHLAKRWKNSWFFLTKFKESKPFSMHFILVYHSVIATANISDRCKSMIWPFILLKMLNHKRASEWKKNYCVCVFDEFHAFHDIPSTTQSLWKRCRSNGKTKCAQNGLEFIFIFEIFWLII